MLHFLQRNHKIIIALTALLFAACLHATAGHTPTCPIVTERFQGLGDGATSNNSATGWYIDASNVSGTGYFAVKSNRFHAQELGGEGRWYSKVFSVAGYTDFQVAVKVTSEGDMNSSEYVKVYYKINGGAETLLASNAGNFGTLDFISPLLNGNNVQIVVKIYNYNNGGSQTSKYYIEEYRVFKEHGPCSGSILVSASAGNGGILTCSQPALALSATTAATGTTTWSWTGPNGFTSTSQNPSVNTPGTYTVTGTNGGASASASVSVSENKAAPVVTATGANLACAANVTISAASSISGSSYSWAGPNGFTSNLQNPSVNTAGTYTVTVINPANGCSASKSVAVTGGASTPSALWTENFTAANGTTSTAAWSSAVPAGVFSVQNNEFRVTNNGASNEGVWTSGSINIAGNSLISISAGVRSGVSSGGALENSGSSLDYVRLYYKLNNGPEILFAEYSGTINSNSATNTTASVGSLGGSTLQVVIRARTTASDEFYYFDDITVSGIASSVTITPAVSGTVTCTSTAQLSATVAGGTASGYSWTGPNGFASSLQNPVVAAGGQYVVTATLSSGGCSVSAPITVAENKTTPDITASGGSLGCLASITLNAISSVPGASFSWSGPNGFASTLANPVVTTPGSYTVTVTNPINGCTASQLVTVTASSVSWLENFSLSNGTTVDNGATSWSVSIDPSTSVFSVYNNEFRISNSTTTGQSVWTSGVISINGINSVSISANVRSSVVSGAAMNATGDYADYIRFYYKLNNGAEVLFAEKLGSVNDHSITPETVSVNALSGSTLQVVVKARATGNDEFYYVDNISMSGANITNTDATASALSSLSCVTTSVALSGSSTVANATYSWTGPGGFSSAAQNPVVNTPGIYTLTVTNPATGCTATDTAIVQSNTAAPGAIANAGESLSCSSNAITLSGSSSTAGVSFSWSGPNGFTSSQQNPVVTQPGTYTLVVTNPLNGCTSTQAATVAVSNSTTGPLWTEDFTLPDGTSSDNGATSWSTAVNPSTTLFSTSNNQFRVSNSSTTGEGVWTSGVIDISGKTNIGITASVRSAITGGAIMNSTGEYADYIRFYYRLNNGAEVLFAEKSGIINDHSTTPEAVAINALSGNSLQIVVRARATGVDEFYYFDNVQVTGTSQGMVEVIASPGSTLTCINTSTTLSGSSGTPGAVYNWSGPGGFTSSQQNPAIDQPGMYILTVTAGYCAASDTVFVQQNITPPANLTTASVSGSNELTCLVGGLTLTGSSTTAGAAYSWKLPNGVVITASGTGATQEGDYIFTATNPANGCTASDTFSVVRNMSTPLDGSIAGGNQWLTCVNTSVVLSASNNLAGVTFNWIGPNGFTASGPVATVTEPGFYNVIMTHPVTGCNHSIGASVFRNTTPPAELAITVTSANTQITCVNGSVRLTGNSSSSSATYKWTGPGGYTASTVSVDVSSPGEYMLIATNPDNGCTSNATKVIVENRTLPANVRATAATNSGVITCTVQNILLEGASSTPGAMYAWSGPGFSAATANVTVNTAGNYLLTVTDPVNGCSATAEAAVTINNDPPAGVFATFSDVLTCATRTVDLTGTSTTPGVTYQWSGPGGFSAATAITQTAVPGTYQLRVTNSANGCYRDVFTTVEQNITKPADVTADNTGPLTCANTSVLLVANTSSPDVDYMWTGPNDFISFSPVAEVMEPGEYVLIVTDLATNGCADTAVTVVLQDLTGCGARTIGTKGNEKKGGTPPVGGKTPVASLELPLTFEYKAYPNPFAGRAFIELRSPVDDVLQVELYNSSGLLSQVLFSGEAKGGRLYKLNVDGEKFPAGVYYYVIRNKKTRIASGTLLLAR